MELSHPWEATSSSFTQEYPNVLWNLKVHYHIHKNLPLLPYSELDQSSPYHIILFL
jgi:hypothetical protein